ncbi:MAG: hypothetical protein QW434_01085 [Pyrobaculum sp.]
MPSPNAASRERYTWKAALTRPQNGGYYITPNPDDLLRGCNPPTCGLISRSLSPGLKDPAAFSTAVTYAALLTAVS